MIKTESKPDATGSPVPFECNNCGHKPTPTEAGRRHLLRSETSDEIASLYATAVHHYGDDAPATHTLASVLRVRIAKGWQNIDSASNPQ